MDERERARESLEGAEDIVNMMSEGRDEAGHGVAARRYIEALERGEDAGKIPARDIAGYVEFCHAKGQLEERRAETAQLEHRGDDVVDNHIEAMKDARDRRDTARRVLKSREA